MYATIADLRAEGVIDAQASDARLEALIAEASAAIDRMTGWWFEPRARMFRLDGRGTATLEPPVPPIRLDRISAGAHDLSLDPADLMLEGAPVQPGFAAPRLTLARGCFPRGRSNIVLEGLWGYTEPDDAILEGRTPLEIRRACMLLVLAWRPPLARGESSNARLQWRLTALRTVDQSLALAHPGPPGPFTGDPEIDRILARYRRPMPLGAA